MKQYILLCVILFLVIFLLFSYHNTSTSNFSLYEQFFPKDFCRNLIHTANKYQFETHDEPVDRKPVYELDLFTSQQFFYIELWNMIKPYYQNKIVPIVLKKYPHSFLSFVFLRRYNNEERKNLSIHTDANRLSINILLSDIKDYKGGEFYIFNHKQTRKYHSFYEKELEGNENKKEEFIQSFPQLPILNMNQGDCIIYEGDKHLHGVLPVTKGERYILSFFFDEH